MQKISKTKKNISKTCPITGLLIKSDPHWENLQLSETYSVTFKLIGKNVIYVIPSGYCGEFGIELLLKKREIFLKENNLYNKKHIEIKDYSNINGKVSRCGRKQFTNFLLKENKRKKLLGYFGFNSSIIVRIIFNLGIKLYKHNYSIKIYNSYKDAVITALNILVKNGLYNTKKPDSISKKNEEINYTNNKQILYTKEEISSEISNILKYLNSITWDISGNDKISEIDDHNIFKPIFESVALLKHDFYEIIEENKIRKASIIQQNKYNKLRAEIWKISSDTKLPESHMIQQILNLIGPTINVSRACFNKFINDDPKNGDLICEYEWCDRDIKSTKGSKIPSALVKYFTVDKLTILNVENSLKLVPKAIRKIIKPLLIGLANSQNLESVIILPYYIRGKLSGWFTLDICKNKKDKFILTDNIKNVLNETVIIFSSIITKKRVEEELDISYKILEKKVEQRTKELKSTNTELKKRENNILEKNNILETSLDILSHDTKNLFFNIHILLNQIKEKPIKDIIKNSVDELYELVMETAGFMQSKKRIFNIPDLISRIKITKKRISIKDHKRIKISYSDHKFLFSETSSLLKNAVTNLIENALKYSPESEKVKINIKRLKDKIIIKVVDKGCGIPEQEKREILKKYYRMEKTKAIEGTGRGLWITNNIIKKEGGKLLVKNNKKGGTIFIIEIPVYKIENLKQGLQLLSKWFNLPVKRLKEKSESVRTLLILQKKDNVKDLDTLIFTELLTLLRESNKKKYFEDINRKLRNLKKLNPEGKSILIVDDSIYVHYYLANYFIQMGYRICDYAKNGKDGLFLYKKHKPDYITLDNTMPIMSGLEASKKIYEFDNNVKILFITALGDIQYLRKEIEKCIPKKNLRILTKPINQEKLKKTIINFK